MLFLHVFDGVVLWDDLVFTTLTICTEMHIFFFIGLATPFCS